MYQVLSRSRPALVPLSSRSDQDMSRSRQMEVQLSADKVTPLFMKTSDTPTGTCAVRARRSA